MSEATLYYGESLLRRYLDHLLPFIPHQDNARPAWLRGYELDRYYPALYLGFEFQGDQHYTRTSPDFAYAGDRDRVKRVICHAFGVEVVEVTARGLDSWWLTGQIKGALWRNRHLGFLARLGLVAVLPPPLVPGLGGLDEAAALYRRRLLRRNPQSVSARTFDGRLSWWQKIRR